MKSVNCLHVGTESNSGYSAAQKLEGGDIMKSKMVLMIVGVIVLLMGILALVPDLDYGSEPSWHAVLKIIIGLVALYVGYTDKG